MFNAIRLKLASPEDILKWSHGEVTKPETINYRTQRPEKDGLFSERIFGPTKDWECYCGKYRKVRYKGVVCDRCGVEVTRALVRRERLGHISLAAPVVHIWFLKNVPSKLSLVLNMPVQQLEKVIYYAAYVVTKVNEENKKRVLDDVEREYKTRKKEEGMDLEALKAGAMEVKDAISSLRPGKVLNETDYHILSRRFGDVFEAGSGAEAIRKILENLDLGAIIEEIKAEMAHAKDAMKDQRVLRRLKLVTGMHRSGVRPEWMIMTALPILPPDLRPMVALDGGRYATSDLNDLYRRVINRNNRLKKLLELNAPEVIVKNEKRMLQESVDALIDNSARLGAQQLSAQRRPLRSLADMLKGKQGRFRQNLLGKRVDYSGRSVIVVGPNLKLNQCGLPKRMALELFKPFVISKIIEGGLTHNIRNANRLVEQAPPEVWAILEEVIGDRKVLLNRAPTLHRLGIQAFNPILVEDLAIQVPPMVCTAFNADFDGDQMAVHLPLGEEAQREATELMLSSVNLLKPATGDPIATPSQDVVLGCYYLTKIHPKAIGAGKAFGTKTEAMMAFEHDYVAINAPITVEEKKETSIGQLIFNEALPADYGYVSKTMTKKELSKLVSAIIEKYGLSESAKYLDRIKAVGFEYATRSGITWSMSDLITPPQKVEIMERAEKEIALVQEQYEQGLLTELERRARVIEIWTATRKEIETFVKGGTLDSFNPVFSIIDSGSRGSWAPVIQMMGMKGLVANPKNETIELPIKTSLKEGHTVLEYFISTHGARKGTTDTALKTASAGYLTRRLVDVAQDIVTREEDCGTKEGVEITAADSVAIGQPISERIFSRTALEDVTDGKTVFVKAGDMIDRIIAQKIQQEGVKVVKVRSPITCKTLYGVCSKCYGLDLGYNKPIALGQTVGIIAAQSIGEPGTQLTMRTFHAGGIAGADITHGLPRVEELFEARPPKGRAFMADDDGVVDEIEERGSTKVIRINPKTKTKNPLEYAVGRTTEILVKAGETVEKGQQLCEGNLDLKELFKHRGARAVERYIINEVQRIYASEGAAINNKHIEVIVRQLFSRVRVKDAGDSQFVVGDVVEKSRFLEMNRALKQEGKTPARAVQLLMGITRVALSTESFFSAASFQQTPRVLVEASVEGKIDTLRGLKENVIIGRLIPGGTTFNKPVEFDNPSFEDYEEKEGV